MIKDINIRFNFDKEEHKKAWDYMQKMDRSVEKSYSKVIIKSLIRYFENIYPKDEIEMSEIYWRRFRSEMENTASLDIEKIQAEYDAMAAQKVQLKKMYQMAEKDVAEADKQLKNIRKSCALKIFVF